MDAIIVFAARYLLSVNANKNLKTIYNMKKILTLVAVAAALMTGNVAKAQISIGAGYVQNDIITSATILGTTVNDTLSRPGLYVGFDYNFPLTKSLSLSAGANVEYFTDGDTVNILGLAGVASDFTQVDLVIPVRLNYTFNLPAVKITLFAGPTINFGLVNKTDYHAEVLGVGKDWTTNWFENEDSDSEAYYSERFRWGVTGGARVDVGSFGVQAGYTYGMSDNYSSELRTGKSNHLFVGLVYNL